MGAAVGSFEALTKVIEDFDAGAGRQDRGRIRMARAQAGGMLPRCSICSRVQWIII